MLYFALCKAQPCGLSPEPRDGQGGRYELEPSQAKESGDQVFFSGRCSSHSAAARSSCHLLQGSRLWKTAFTADFCGGPRAPDVDVRQFGLTTPRIQAQTHASPHGNSAEPRNKSVSVTETSDLRSCGHSRKIQAKPRGPKPSGRWF